MRFVCALVAALLAFAAGPAMGQLASPFSHGPTLPLYAINFDSTGNAFSSFMAAGAGYTFNRNFLPGLDGRVRWLTVGLTSFFKVPPNAGLSFALGPHVGTYNDLLSIGAVFDMANLGPEQSGLLVGDFGKENVKLLLSFNLNFGFGSPGTEKGSRSAPPTPPPNYYKFW